MCRRGIISKALTRHGSTLLAGTSGLERAKQLVTDYKMGKIASMTPELWHAKKVVDSTLHPGTTDSPLLPNHLCRK